MTSPPTPVSSSTTLWATASKEWVIQPKPKPGRKPKKDVAPPVKDDEEVDSKGRRVQNRAAQRAFRERKQSQLAELQARVQSYEQGEIERNVALQNIAKRLKEENEKLRMENLLLKEKVSRIEQEPRDNEKKRWRDDSPSSVASGHPTRKRTKITSESPNSITQPPHFSASYISSPPSMVSSPDSNGTSDTRFSPLPFESHAGDPSHNSSLSNLLSFPPSVKPGGSFEPGSVFPTFDCGFCNEDTPCVCREIAMQQAAAERMGLKMENFEPNNSIAPIERSIRLESPPASAQPSILDNLPAYQPPVPLRRRAMASNLDPVFRVVPVPPSPRTTPANCSGDPDNCMACADDSFGRAFCAAIGESVATMAPCVDCPCTHDATDPAAPDIPPKGCCGDPIKCNRTSTSQLSNTSSTSNSLRGQPDSETIPTDDAWRQLKLHPNVAFTDLSLLADVVARRSKCTGPRVVISPAPGSITPERAISPPAVTGTARAAEADHQPVLLTDPHAHYREKERKRSRGPSPAQLVPQDVLQRCGRQPLREVYADAVQDALRLLDSKFPRS